MIRLSDLESPFTLVELGDCVEVLDRLRKPVNVDARRGRVGDIPYYGANGQVGCIDKWIFDEELVLVAEDGGFFYDPFKPISYRISGKAWVNNHAHVLRPTSRVDIDWLNYAVSHQDVTNYIKGATLKKLNQQDLRKIRIPLPDFDEQRRIVARIKKCMERVEEIEALRNSSLIQQQHLSASLIESELHPEHAEEYGWVLRTVGELVTTIRNGRSIAQDTEGQANGAVLTLTAVRSIDLGIGFQKPINLPDNIANQFGVDAGDVFVSRANTIELVGLAAIAMEKPTARLIYPDLLIKLKADPSQILPRYLVYALRSASARKQIKSRALGSSQTMVKISGERLREVSIPVPSLAEQEEIISRLDMAHELMQQLASESLPGEIEMLRSAILRKAFAGEL